MSEKIKSIQDDLHICNKDMPALEEFDTWGKSESSEQKEIVKKLYKDFIQRSEIKDNFCYLDLTFELPDKGAITITFTSTSSQKGYRELLENYIQQHHTIYKHPKFWQGYLSNGSGLEQDFLMIKLSQSKNSLPTDFSTLGQIEFSDINLQYLYDGWEETDWTSFYESTIDENVKKWLEIHEERRNSIKSLTGKELAWILVIPVGILDNKDQFKLIGGLYLGLDDACHEDSILSFVRSILLPLITNYQRYETKRAYKNAIKSAKAAIIARNMSHNLGSHVLYYLRQYLSGDISQFNEILENIVIKENENGNGEFSILYKKETSDGKFELGNAIDKKFEVPFLRGLGTFLTYLQERQDFIASVATDSIPSYTTVNFKNFVIDNLLKDKKAIRHGNESRKEKNILLDFIAKSENTIVEIKFNGHSLDHSKPLSEEGDGKDLYSYMVDLPGGVLGRQAIYSILENIIRNAAKHGFKNDSESKKLEIDISIEESPEDEDYFLIRVTDNIPLKTGDYDIDQLKTGNHVIYQSKTGNHVIDQLKDYLSDDLIDKSHKLIDDHKGLKEILISALWLCGENVADIKNMEREKYIKVQKSAASCLQYEFKLYRAKSLLVVCDEKQAVNEFKDYTCIDYRSYQLNRDKCKRYNLVIDCTDGFKLKNEKDGFRRYIKEKIKPTNVLDEKLYIEYFKHFLSNSFGNEILRRTQFLIAIDDNNVTNNREINAIEDANLSTMFSTEKGRIIFDSVFDADKSDVRRIIAFRRHLQDIPDKFLAPNFRNFNINDNHDATLKKIDNVRTQYVNIESITGNNSSFSMIANAAIDDLWVLRQLEAGYAKILIIDERLFDTFSIVTAQNSEEVDTIIGEGDVIPNNFSVKNDCTRAAMMRLKNVEIANVASKNLINIWGNRIGWYDVTSKSFQFNDNYKYDYITIHQGILDKLFNLYGDGYKEGKDGYFDDMLYNLRNKAMIKCLIHTGRGKPNYIKGRMAYRSLSDLDDALKEPKIYLIDYFNCASYEYE